MDVCNTTVHDTGDVGLDVHQEPEYAEGIVDLSDVTKQRGKVVECEEKPVIFLSVGVGNVFYHGKHALVSSPRILKAFGVVVGNAQVVEDVGLGGG